MWEIFGIFPLEEKASTLVFDEQVAGASFNDDLVEVWFFPSDTAVLAFSRVFAVGTFTLDFYSFASQVSGGPRAC